MRTLSRSFLAGHVSTGSAAISEDGQLVAAGPMQRAISSGDTGRERRIHVWDTFTGELKFLLKGHQSNVAALMFSSDRRWIISADYSGTEPRRIPRRLFGLSQAAIFISSLAA